MKPYRSAIKQNFYFTLHTKLHNYLHVTKLTRMYNAQHNRCVHIQYVLITISFTIHYRTASKDHWAQMVYENGAMVYNGPLCECKRMQFSGDLRKVHIFFSLLSET